MCQTSAFCRGEPFDEARKAMVAHWPRKGRRSGAAPARCKRRQRRLGAACGEAGRRGRQRGSRGIYRQGQRARELRISSIRARGGRRLRVARRGCLSRAVREVGDGLTCGAHLAVAARGGERGRARGGRPGGRLRARGRRPWAKWPARLVGVLLG